MRIVGGKFSGRKFYPPADEWPTRPTTDYSKEGLFNILNNWWDFEGMKVLDLFGGTGNHSYEFISRGCKDVTYVDKFPPAIKFVKTTAESLKITDEIKIIHSDVFSFIGMDKGSFDYIFAGPPYGLIGLDTIPEKILSGNLLDKEGWLVLEHNPHHNFEQDSRCFDVRRYGKTIFSFFSHSGKP
jgi:16S rRNA (guanine966-N2)-methyltransferase